MNNIFMTSLFLFAVLSVKSQNYFQQQLNYKIEVALNDVDHTLTGNFLVEYHNNSKDTLAFIYFHLWPNAYKNNQTALAKQLLENGQTNLHFASQKDRGYIDSLDFNDLSQKLKWELDEEHIDICKVYLRKPLLPGDKTVITTPFIVKIPSGKISRLGHIGQSYQITQWYPKPAVYDQNGWHQMPYLNQGEFYSEFGSFNVSITLPKNYVVGATGQEFQKSELQWLDSIAEATKKRKIDFNSEFPPSSKETKTLNFKQEKVHDFAWFADKRYNVLKGEVELPHSGKKVTTWAMFTSYSHKYWKKSIEYLNDAIYYYSLWNGDYPYNQVTAVDGTISAGGGMEYPNITVIGNTKSDIGLEVVIMHEVGHNWFYGILGSNERDHPWMDEGLNSLNEMRYMETKYDTVNMRDVIGVSNKAAGIVDCRYRVKDQFGYLLQARRGLDQPIELPSAEYSSINYGVIVYSKTALAFNYLKDYLGEVTFDQCMRAYFEYWKFKHPQPKDLRAVFEKETKQNLSWFFDEIITTAKKIDYKVTAIDSNEVIVKNVGDLAVPISVSSLKEGEEMEKVWINTSEKEKITFKNTDFDQVIIDYESNVPEVNRKNNFIQKKGLLKKVEPLKMKFLLGAENQTQTTVNWMPLIAWNEYDKGMLGVNLSNVTIPNKKVEFSLAPMYSFSCQDLSGLGNIGYAAFLDEGIIHDIELDINVSQFHYLENNSNSSISGFDILGQYQRIAPEVNVNFRKASLRDTRSLQFRAKHINITEKLTATGVGFDQGNIQSHNIYNSFNEGSLIYKDKQTLKPLRANLKLQQHQDFQRLSLEYNQRFYYDVKRNSVMVRVFVGMFLQNNTTNPVYNFQLDGRSMYEDYTYSHLTMFRTETENLSSHQFIDSEGGFKIPVTGGSSNDWMASINTQIDLPLMLPIDVTADLGFFPVNQSTGKPEIRTYYSVGGSIPIVRNVIEVYFPFFYSSDIREINEINNLDYWDTVRFTLHLEKLNPFKLLKESI